MRIDLVFPTLPPTIDGIGDHTARLATTLAKQGWAPRVLTAQHDWTPLAGVPVQRAFHCEHRRGVLNLVSTVRSGSPDWLFLQFNQFSYGQWGLNPFLPLALYRIKNRCPEVRLAVMFHEDFLPATTLKDTIMSTWQRAQFWVLGRLADHVFFSIDPWVQQYRSWFPETPVEHLPVGSNISRVDADEEVVRKELGIADETTVLGVFGSLHESRLLSHIQMAARAVQDEGDVILLYVGPDGEAFQDAMEDLPVLNAGPLPAGEVSRRFHAMDMYLAPFIDGASTRRGSFLVGLQHGVPTVSTRGSLTDSMLLDQNQNAFALTAADDPEAFQRSVVTLCEDAVHRRRMRRNAQHFFSKHFRWEVLTERLLKQLCHRRHASSSV